MSEGKKKFSGDYEVRDFFDRRVRVQGGSRIISLGKIIPEDWSWVRLTKIEETPKLIVVHMERLELALADAPVARDDSEGE